MYGDAARLRSGRIAGRYDTETAIPADPVSLEVIVINRQNQTNGMAIRKMDQGCVGEIHRPIAVFVHKSIERGKIGIRNRCKRQGAGPNEFPCRANLTRVVTDKMKQFRKYRL